MHCFIPKLSQYVILSKWTFLYVLSLVFSGMLFSLCLQMTHLLIFWNIYICVMLSIYREREREKDTMVSTVMLQQDGSVFEPHSPLVPFCVVFACSHHACVGFLWVTSGFLPQSKDRQISITSYSNLPLGVNVNSWSPMFWPCDGLDLPRVYPGSRLKLAGIDSSFLMTLRDKQYRKSIGLMDHLWS